MTKEREALKQALEAIKDLLTEFRLADLPYGSKAYAKGNNAVHALEESLAQQEQEPLTDAERKSYQAGHNAGVAHHKQATKREWVKLNDEQYIQISDTTFHAGRGLVAFARGIEAKLKELNHE